ncbi:sigma-70 family RNA polymerase sigma factor [Vibrio cincinnatiensis]|uniref:sigma-70 family RNA polymerase sigma factor n=1 Tax=Vibrio cincinnatiensis TaxID=675 RepID=UPI001EDE8732|nr:sigma-70 family RNA polymerase sigma factor [Vibrio cincinnatiensis]MCG3728133.1 sigma-70 family RNA polymerase sigma factor [Vibrio cincinnatiensis]
MNSTHSTPVPCLLDTWHRSESTLFRWLVKQCQDHDLEFDLLQDTFLRALQQEYAFCDITHQRAWLFRVSANLLADQWRANEKLSFDEQWLEKAVEMDDLAPTVDSLAQCLPKALRRLEPADKMIIEACDLNGMSQYAFAQQHGLSLSAAKSRIQRAREKLRQTLKTQCQIRFDDQQRACCFVPRPD